MYKHSEGREGEDDDDGLRDAITLKAIYHYGFSLIFLLLLTFIDDDQLLIKFDGTKIKYINKITSIVHICIHFYVS